MSAKETSLASIIDPFRKEQPSHYWDILELFVRSYEEILRARHLDLSFYHKLITTFCEKVADQIREPFQFEPFHKCERAPFDFYQFGLDLFRPPVDFKQSFLCGKENLLQIDQQLKAGENVILFANHQTEADPEAISYLIEEEFPHLAEEMIFVAGERVVTDALAVPFSRGRNLFCIYSKKYFAAHEARKVEMIEHNKMTVSRITKELAEGGKCIYIAPSGGRDRKNSEGVIEVAYFDPQSIELLYLLGLKSKKPTHYYPLALSTYNFLPPPEGVQINLGEARPTNFTPIHLHFGEEIDMTFFDSCATVGKETKRVKRAERIWHTVCEMYKAFPPL